MKSAQRGRRISVVEVANVSPNGLWLLVGDREFFLPFRDYPWFEHASIRALANVTRPHAQHLYWPDLDVDLDVDTLEHPDRYPLKSRVAPSAAQPKPDARRTSAAGRGRRKPVTRTASV
jgi:hypothetical protein